MSLLDIIIILALATLPALFFKKKFGVETQGPLCLWRTKKGLRLLDKLAKYKRFLSAFSDLGLVFAFGVFGAGYLFLSSKRRKKDILKVAIAYLIFLAGASIVAVPVIFTSSSAVPLEFLASLYIGGLGSFMLYGLLLNTWIIIQNYLTGYIPMPGLQPLIPGVHIEGSPLYVPFHAIFGLIVLIVVHEVAHGIVARKEKIKVKSLGILTAGIFPIGAFTEPDENQLKKVEVRKRLRVFSVGSMSNFLFGIFFMLLFLGSLYIVQPRFVQDPTSITPSYVPWSKEYVNYLEVAYVDNGSVAQKAGITNGTKIYNIDAAFSEKKPFAIETFVTDKGTVLLQRNASGYFGFSYVSSRNTDYSLLVWFKKYFIESLFWIFLLNFLIGVINYLPFAIFDGARIFEDLFIFYAGRIGIKNKKKVGRKAVTVLTVFILALLFINALPYFVAKF
jgi:membrane-associated protease RseP (regulator of RpoE activity)